MKHETTRLLFMFKINKYDSFELWGELLQLTLIYIQAGDNSRKDSPLNYFNVLEEVSAY